MKKYGGSMMPLQERSHSRQSSRARESPAASEAEIDNVLDGSGDYSFDASALSAQENSELNAKGPGGGPAFTEAEKFFYHEVVKLFTKKNLKLLRDLLPGSEKMKSSDLKKKYKFIKNNFDVTYYISQLSCGCNRSKPKSGSKNNLLNELSKVQSESGIPEDIDDMIKLRKKTNDLTKRGILKTYNLSEHLNAATVNAFDFIGLLDHVSEYIGNVKCSDTTYLRKKLSFKHRNEFDSIKIPTGVSGPIETAVTTRSPMRNTEDRTSTKRNTRTTRATRRPTKKSPRTRRHPSKPVNPKCGIEILKFQKIWESTTTLGEKHKIISDMLNFLESMKEGLIKCKPGEIESFQGKIGDYLEIIREKKGGKLIRKKGKTNKRKKGKTNKRKK